MELIKELHILKEQDKLNVDELNRITSPQNLFFIITEAMLTGKKEYNNLYSLFEEIRAISIEQGGINIFEEFLTLKYFYLESVFGLDTVVLDALMSFIGPVALDYELEKRFLKEDDFYQYYLTRYNQFKQNNEFSMLKLIDSLKIDDLQIEGDKLEELIQEMKNMTSPKN